MAAIATAAACDRRSFRYNLGLCDVTRFGAAACDRRSFRYNRRYWRVQVQELRLATAARFATIRARDKADHRRCGLRPPLVSLQSHNGCIFCDRGCGLRPPLVSLQSSPNRPFRQTSCGLRPPLVSLQSNIQARVCAPGCGLRPPLVSLQLAIAS